MKDPILAKAFAFANDNEQADMLNSMARELFVICKGGVGYESQVCMLVRHLNKDGISFVKELHQFVLLREKEMP